jgi:hypothetical protein
MASHISSAVSGLSDAMLFARRSRSGIQTETSRTESVLDGSFETCSPRVVIFQSLRACIHSFWYACKLRRLSVLRVLANSRFACGVAWKCCLCLMREFTNNWIFCEGFFKMGRKPARQTFFAKFADTLEVFDGTVIGLLASPGTWPVYRRAICYIALTEDPF